MLGIGVFCVLSSRPTATFHPLTLSLLCTGRLLPLLRHGRQAHSVHRTRAICGRGPRQAAAACTPPACAPAMGVFLPGLHAGPSSFWTARPSSHTPGWAGVGACGGWGVFYRRNRALFPLLRRSSRHLAGHLFRSNLPGPHDSSLFSGWSHLHIHWAPCSSSTAEYITKRHPPLAPTHAQTQLLRRTGRGRSTPAPAWTGCRPGSRTWWPTCCSGDPSARAGAQAYLDGDWAGAPSPPGWATSCTLSLRPCYARRRMSAWPWPAPSLRRCACPAGRWGWWEKRWDCGFV